MTEGRQTAEIMRLFEDKLIILEDMLLRLTLIQQEAQAELDRIDHDGGCAGFALRVLALAKGENDAVRGKGADGLAGE